MVDFFYTLLSLGVDQTNQHTFLCTKCVQVCRCENFEVVADVTYECTQPPVVTVQNWESFIHEK